MHYPPEDRYGEWLGRLCLYAKAEKDGSIGTGEYGADEEDAVRFWSEVEQTCLDTKARIAFGSLRSDWWNASSDEEKPFQVFIGECNKFDLDRFVKCVLPKERLTSGQRFSLHSQLWLADHIVWVALGIFAFITLVFAGWWFEPSRVASRKRAVDESVFYHQGGMFGSPQTLVVKTPVTWSEWFRRVYWIGKLVLLAIPVVWILGRTDALISLAAAWVPGEFRQGAVDLLVKLQHALGG